MPRSKNDYSLGRSIIDTFHKGEPTHASDIEKHISLMTRLSDLTGGRVRTGGGRDKTAYISTREFLTLNRADVGGNLFSTFGSYDIRPVSSIASFSSLFRAGAELISDLTGRVYPISVTAFPLLAAGVQAQAISGTTAANSPVITALTSTSGLVPSMTATATSIPANAFILSVDSATQVTLTVAATAAGTVSIAFGPNPDQTAPANPSQPVFSDQSSANSVSQLVSPIRASASFNVSNQLFEIATPKFEQVLKRSISIAVSNILDFYGIFGSGQSGQPYGIWYSIPSPSLSSTGLSYTNFLDFRRQVQQANVETATGIEAILSPLMHEYCDVTSAFGNTHSLLDRMRDGLDKIVVGLELALGPSSSKTMIIGSFDVVKLLVWSPIEVLINKYSLADQNKTKITVSVMLNTAISLPSALVGWNQS